MTNRKVEEMKFEEALAELEQIVQELEQNNVELDEALEQYQRGIELSKYCRQQLENAEKMVAKVVTESGEEAAFISDEAGEGEGI